MKKKNNNFKKPNIFVYWFFKTASKIYTKLYFNRKVIRNEIFSNGDVGKKPLLYQ